MSAVTRVLVMTSGGPGTRGYIDTMRKIREAGIFVDKNGCTAKNINDTEFVPVNVDELELAPEYVDTLSVNGNVEANAEDANLYPSDKPETEKINE